MMFVCSIGKNICDVLVSELLSVWCVHWIAFSVMYCSVDCILCDVLLSRLHSLWCVVQRIALHSPSPIWTLRPPVTVATTMSWCWMEMMPVPHNLVATVAPLFPRPWRPQAPTSSWFLCLTSSCREWASALCTHDPLPVSHLKGKPINDKSWPEN